jgi:8-oxo-dGTP pyrophosphatase MutT (NUDIX family)
MPKLFELVPALRDVSHPLLVDQQVILVGVSAVLHDEEAYYFEVSRPRHWGQLPDGTRAVGIGGIGGRIETGESVLACLRREVREELDVGFQLEDPMGTALVHDGEFAAWLDLPDRDGGFSPYIVNLLPPQLARPDQPDHLAIVTFLGRLQRKPQRGDLFGLLTVFQSGLEPYFERSEWPWEEAAGHPDFTFDLSSDLPKGSILRPTLTGRAFQVLVQRGYTP